MEVAAGFPPPPQQFRHFTDEAWNAFQELEASRREPLPEAGASNDNPSSYFQPPAPPEGLGMTAFGRFTFMRYRAKTLGEQGLQQLGTDAEAATDAGRVALLKRLCQSLLFNYMELVRVLIRNPAQWVVKVQDIETILFNWHHLLNDARLAQSQQRLARHLERQTARRRALAAKLASARAAAHATLGQLGARPSGSDLTEDTDVPMDDAPAPASPENAPPDAETHPTHEYMRALLDRAAALVPADTQPPSS